MEGKTFQKLEKDEMVGLSSAQNVDSLDQSSDKITCSDSQHDKTSQKPETMVGSSSALHIEPLNQYSDKITDRDSQQNNTSQKSENDEMIGLTSAQIVESPDQSSDKITDRDSRQHVENPVDDEQLVDMAPVENTEGAPAEGTNNKNQLTELMVALMSMVKDLANELKHNANQVLEPQPISARKTPSDQDVVVLDVAPISAWRSPDEDMPESSRPQKKKKTPSHLLGDMNATFEVINGVHADTIDLNELIVAAFGEEYAKNVKELQKLSFTQRLKGWKLECRSRSSGKCDQYYYHAGADKTFRSVKEVADFMLFEAYPGGKYTLKDFFKLGDGGASSSGGSARRRKKTKRDIPLNEEAPPQADAVKFLEEAHGNLLKFFDP